MGKLLKKVKASAAEKAIDTIPFFSYIDRR